MHLMVRLRRWRKRLCLISSTFLLVVFIISSPLLNTIFRCSNMKSRQALRILCDDYKSGKASGKICSDLCSLSGESGMKFRGCINYKYGKQVFEVRWRGELHILKSLKPYMNEYERTSYLDKTSHSHQHITPQVFYSLLENTVRLNLNVNDTRGGSRLASLIYQQEFPGGSEVEESHVAMDNVWSLARQDEYLLNVYFKYSNNGSRHLELPQLFGTCGHFYLVENVPTPWFMSPSLLGFAWMLFADWSVRAGIALSLIDVMKVLEREYPQTLHMCDMKPDNFGLSSRGGGRVVITDLDSLIMSPNLMRELSSESCQVDGDCDFFDCKGRCDVKRGHCTVDRVNNNYQVLCHDILLSSSSNLYTGLLKYPPSDIKSRLDKLLTQCAFPCPHHIADRTRCQASETVIGELTDLLKSVLQYYTLH